MPQFSPNEAKTAIAPIIAKPSGMNCEAELFLGPDEATKVVTSGRVPFVSTGAEKNVSLPITMPSSPGTHHGYIDVFAGGFRFLAYILKEDVVIAAPVALPFTMSITRIDTIDSDKYATAYWLMQPVALISNPHSTPITHRLRFIVCYGSSDPNLLSSYLWTRCWGGGAPGTPQDQLYELPVTLNPGQSITVVSPFYYIDGLWGWERANPYEWSNMPPGMYSAGVRKKYWFRIIDELGNWSPVKSVGTA